MGLRVGSHVVSPGVAQGKGGGGCDSPPGPPEQGRLITQPPTDDRVHDDAAPLNFQTCMIIILSLLRFVKLSQFSFYHTPTLLEYPPPPISPHVLFIPEKKKKKKKKKA